MITVTQALQDLAAIEKARKKKDREAAPEALTPAHEAAQAEADAMMDGETAGKAISQIGCTDPGAGIMDPHRMLPSDAYNRPYVESGTAAPGPGYQAPNVAPLPPQHPGILQPLPQSPAPAVVAGGGPVVAGLAQHQARAAQSAPPMP
jgi:hypothetical protein